MATTSAGTGLTKGARITGPDRQALGARLAERYQAGESIRSLAQETGRSFGFVHGVIKESGVQLRARGGATRRPAASTAPEPRVAAAPVEEATVVRTGKAKKAEAKKAAKKSSPKKADAKQAEPKKEKGAGKKKGRS